MSATCSDARSPRAGSSATPRGVVRDDLQFYKLVVGAVTSNPPPGQAVSRDELYASLRGISYDGVDRGMDIHVARLRRKLRDAGADPDLIKSVRGTGYQLGIRR